MSTAKGFQGWGEDSICKRYKGTGRYKESVTVWDELPGQVNLGHGRMRLEGGKSHTESIIRDCMCGDNRMEGDEKLLRYLYEHKHHTPFEMAGMIVEVQAPILVFREWHRHRTQSYNEMSARYIQMPNLHYVPSAERIRAGGQDNKNRQGSSPIGLDDDRLIEGIQDRIRELQYEHAGIG